MLARAPLAIFPSLVPAGYVRHALHAHTRDWPEASCYADIWIEVLHALGRDPTVALGFTVAQDFEGDHFTFAKMPLEDLRELFGLEVTELALYDTLERHVVEQVKRGRLVLAEVDSFGLPDTRGVAYRLEHVKTTVAINRIDPDARTLDYFHGPGFFTLAGADYEAVLGAGQQTTALFPYAEFVKFEGLRAPPGPAQGLALLHRHLARRPRGNPVLAFRDRLREQVVEAAAREQAFLHRYAFNTTRQLGTNFELLGDHLAWLAAAGAGPALSAAAVACKTLSGHAKSFQFQLARAVARKRFDAIEAAADPMAAAYDNVAGSLKAL